MDGYSGALKQALTSGAGFNPIGGNEETNSFSGTFDGANNVICSLYENINTTGQALAGFFKTTYGEIKNLGLVNVNITAIAQGENSASVGGIVRTSYNNIYNCFVTGNIKTEGSSWMPVGGICGILASKDISIENCYNLANIECKNLQTETGNSDISCGGILGQTSSGGIGSTINKCFNKGQIIVDGGVNSANVGGVCGVFNMGGNIKNSFNNAKIECTSNSFAAEGGIVGNVGYSGQETNIENCYNIGEISGNTNNLAIGGIAGEQWMITSISNVYNTGKITINIKGNSLYAGGISGEAPSGAGNIDDAYNTGILDIQNASVIDNVGSIAGELAQMTLSNCYYLKGTYNVGVAGSDSSTGVTEWDSLDDFPSVLDVVNNEGAFKADTNNINDGYPILEWQ